MASSYIGFRGSSTNKPSRKPQWRCIAKIARKHLCDRFYGTKHYTILWDLKNKALLKSAQHLHNQYKEEFTDSDSLNPLCKIQETIAIIEGSKGHFEWPCLLKIAKVWYPCEYTWIWGIAEAMPQLRPKGLLERRTLSQMWPGLSTTIWQKKRMCITRRQYHSVLKSSKAHGKGTLWEKKERIVAISTKRAFAVRRFYLTVVDTFFDRLPNSKDKHGGFIAFINIYPICTNWNLAGISASTTLCL